MIYESDTPIHVSGHAYQEEIKMMLNLTRPYYVAPVHGEPRHQFMYNNLARDMGYPEHRVFTTAGVPLVMDDTSAHLGQAVTAGRILVDNAGGSGVTDDVLRDRYNVANDGIIVLTIAIDETKGEVVGDPDLQAKGFDLGGVLDAAYDHLIDALRALSREELKDAARVRHTAADVVRRLVHKRAQRRPLVLPMVVEV